VDEERRLRFPFSSEEPVDRWFGKEILLHDRGSVRLGQRQDNLPLLFNHSPGDLLGKVEAIELEDGRLYCTVVSAGMNAVSGRFGKCRTEF
jgi:hypothetical protein